MKGFDADAELDQCRSKFNQEQLRFRRAFSLSNISEGSWVAEGPSDSDKEEPINEYGDEYGDEEPNIKRRYSFPFDAKLGAVDMDPMF